MGPSLEKLMDSRFALFRPLGACFSTLFAVALLITPYASLHAAVLTNVGPSATDRASSYVVTEDATAETGVAVQSLTISGGYALSLDGGHDATAENANTPQGTLQIVGGALTTENGAATIQPGTFAAPTLRFGAPAAVTANADLTTAAGVTVAGSQGLVKTGAGLFNVRGTYAVNGLTDVQEGVLQIKALHNDGDFTFRTADTALIRFAGYSGMNGPKTSYSQFTLDRGNYHFAGTNLDVQDIITIANGVHVTSEASTTWWFNNSTDTPVGLRFLGGAETTVFGGEGTTEGIILRGRYDDTFFMDHRGRLEWAPVIHVEAGTTPSGIDVNMLSNFSSSTAYNPGLGGSLAEFIRKTGPGLMQLSKHAYSTFIIDEGTLQVVALPNPGQLTHGFIVNDGGMLRGNGWVDGFFYAMPVVDWGSRPVAINSGGRIRGGTIAEPYGTLTVVDSGAAPIRGGGIIQTLVNGDGQSSSLQGHSFNLLPGPDDPVLLEILSDPANPLRLNTPYSLNIISINYPSGAAGILIDGVYLTPGTTIDPSVYGLISPDIAEFGDVSLQYIGANLTLNFTPLSFTVPEPSTALLGGLASLSCCGLLRRRR